MQSIVRPRWYYQLRTFLIPLYCIDYGMIDIPRWITRLSMQVCYISLKQVNIFCKKQSLLLGDHDSVLEPNYLLNLHTPRCMKYLLTYCFYSLYNHHLRDPFPQSKVLIPSRQQLLIHLHAPWPPRGK